MWSNCRYIILGFFSLFFVRSQAQIETIVFDWFDESDGLPTSAVIGVLQDSEGILWFNTFDGLTRYDGFNMKTFRHSESNTNSLSSNYVTCLFEDRSGRIWAGTGDGGINVSDSSRSSFCKVLCNNGPAVQSNAIYDIDQDSDGNIWIAGSRGVELIRDSSGHYLRATWWDSISSKADNPTYLTEVDALLFHENKTWIGSSAGISYFDHNSNRLITPAIDNSLPRYNIDDVVLDKEGRVWFSCKSTENRLYYMPKNSDRFEPFFDIRFRSPTTRLHFVFDNDNRIWAAGFEDQLYGYDFRDSTLFLESKTNSNIIDERFLRRPFCDHSGRLWIPSAGYLTYDYDSGVRHYYHPFYFHQSSTAMYKGEKSVWFAYREQGVVRVDLATGQSELLSTAPDSPIRLMSDHIQDIVRTPDGEILLAGYGVLMFINEEQKTIRGFRAGGTTRDLFYDSKGRLWIGRISGLQPYPEHWYRDTTYRLPERNGDTRNFIQAICEDHKGNIWFGSQLKGLSRFEPTAETITQFTPDGEGNRHFPSYNIIDLVVGPGGSLWVATDIGLVKFDPNTFEHTLYDSREGLINDFISSLDFTPSGELWVTTYGGVAQFDLQHERFDFYGSEYGFRNLSFYSRNKFFDGDGAIFFGGKNGVDFFTPSDLRKNPSHPIPYLVSLRIDGNDFHLDQTRDPGTISMNYKQDLLEFEIAGLYYSDQDKVTYEYMVDGIQEDWVDISNRRNITFSNLPPGAYDFRARARSPHGVISETELSIPFNIKPPFWATWWFRSLLVIVILASILIVVQYRERQIWLNQRKESMLQKQIQELEKRALLAQMNPHFIFNSMNSIQQFMAVKDFEGAMRYLTKFSRLLRFVLNISSESRISLTDELTLIEDYIELEKMRFPNKFSYTINIDNGVEVHSLEIPPFFIQPQVENAIRHGLLNKKESGHLKIDIRRQNGDLSIIVEDDGIGREAARKLKIASRTHEKSMGLALVEERLKHIHANYDEHKMTITDLKDHNNKPTGTRVEILLPIE